MPDSEELLDTVLARTAERYAVANPRSHKQWNEARRSMPGGNTRTVIFFTPFPLTFARGDGPHLWDLDGHRYVEILGEFSAGLYGHSHPVIRAAAIRAIEGGVSFGGANISESELARLVRGRFPSCALVRFCNSGTEANLMAICAARAVTGRSKIMVFEGAYHGGILSYSGNVAMNAPFPAVIGSYNDAVGTVDLIEANARDLAAVVVEPMMGASGAIARIQVTGSGSILTVHFQQAAIHSPADVDACPELRALFHLYLIEQGLYISRRGYMALSLALADEHFAAFKATFADFVAEYPELLRAS